MAAKLGITMIEMYCKMIKERFEPIFEALKTREFELEEHCTVLAKKELGIYDKMVRLSKLKLEITALEDELYGYTESSYKNNHKNKIQRLTEQKMKVVRNGFYTKVEEAQRDMLDKVKLSGLDDDTKSVFIELPNVIKKLTNELKKLPAPTKKIKQLR